MINPIMLAHSLSAHHFLDTYRRKYCVGFYSHFNYARLSGKRWRKSIIWAICILPPDKKWVSSYKCTLGVVLLKGTLTDWKTKDEPFIADSWYLKLAPFWVLGWSFSMYKWAVPLLFNSLWHISQGFSAPAITKTHLACEDRNRPD